jgi:hypothetical protein
LTNATIGAVLKYYLQKIPAVVVTVIVIVIVMGLGFILSYFETTKTKYYYDINDCAVYLIWMDCGYINWADGVTEKCFQNLKKLVSVTTHDNPECKDEYCGVEEIARRMCQEDPLTLMKECSYEISCQKKTVFM